jgi:hypothetical protein
MPGFSLSRDLAVVRTLLGGIWGPSEEPGIPSWESRIVIEGPGCAYRGPVLLRGGPDLMMHPVVYHLSLPRGAPRPAHVVGSGAVPVRPGGVVRVQRLYTVVGVPLIQGTDSVR